MPFGCHSGSIQKRFDVFAQRKLHASFRLLEVAGLNGYGWMFAATVPAIISQPSIHELIVKRTCGSLLPGG
jgi:hypothetical protein